MSLSEKKQQLSQGSTGEKIEKTTSQEKASTSREKSLFEPSKIAWNLKGDKNKWFKKEKMGSKKVDKLAEKIKDKFKSSRVTEERLKRYEKDELDKIKKISNLGDKKKAEKELAKEVRVLEEYIK